MIGAGDCPRCGGDVVFDLRGEPVEQTDRPRPVEQTARPRPVEQPDRPPRGGRARALLRRLLGR